MLSKRCFVLLIPVLFLSFHDLGATSYSMEFSFGPSFINSQDLNKIAQGMDAGYVTSFGNIRMPLMLSGGFTFIFGRSRLGLIASYEFASRDSYSPVYDFVGNISYHMIPVQIRYQYSLFERDRATLLGTLSTGLFSSRVSLNTRPAVTSDPAYNMGALGWVLSTGVDLLYRIADQVQIKTSLDGRFAFTNDLTYVGDTTGHKNGEKAVFADGSNLTLTLSGLQFLVGIIFYWG